MINHRNQACNGTVPRMWEVQRAITRLFDQSPPLPASSYPPFRPAVEQCLIDDANANAASWQPKCGDKVAVIYNIDINWDEVAPEVQLIFLEVPYCPPIICPTNVTLECNESLIPGQNVKLGTPTTAEGCTIQSSYSDSITSSNCPGNLVITRTWTSFTECATNTCTQTISVTDTNAPIIECKPDKTIQCPAPLEFDEPTASDACGTVKLTSIDVTTPGTCAGSYSVRRIWTATDECGNTAVCGQTITVVDTTAPVITGVGGPLTVECDRPLVFSEPTATDNCDPLPTLTFADETVPGTCANNKTVTRTWTAKDACGNTTILSQTITVVDTTAPVITGVGGPLTVECDRPLAFSEPKATDNCDPLPTLTSADETEPGSCATAKR